MNQFNKWLRDKREHKPTNAMITKKEWKIVDTAMADVLDKLIVYSPNTGMSLEFDIEGYWRVYHEHDGKTIKKYKVFENAIDYLLNNN